MHLANLLSLVLFVGFVLQYQLVESPRTLVPQLDTSNVSYCELKTCGEVFGVELTNGETAIAAAIQTEIGVSITLDFTNSARYQGRRELWMRIETAPGQFIEAASTWVEFDLKKRSTANFVITGTTAEISQAVVFLGY